MKRQIRVIGIDDSPFVKGKDKRVMLFGAVFRGGDFMDGLLTAKVSVDGDDATEKIASMILKSKFYPQIQAVFLNGIAVGGFNIIDINLLSRKTKIPVITIIRKMPDIKKMKETLARIGMKEKISLLDKAPKIEKHEKIYFQRTNIPLDDAKKIIRICRRNSDVPECLRISHMIASGVKFGESRGGN